MEKLDLKSRFLRFVYQQVFLRLSGKIRDPYLIRIDNIFTDPTTNELSVSYHIANKRVNEITTVSNFVKLDMIYLIDPRIVFDMGQQFGAHSEKLTILEKKQQPGLKNKCVSSIKRVFVDE